MTATIRFLTPTFGCFVELFGDVPRTNSPTEQQITGFSGDSCGRRRRHLMVRVIHGQTRYVWKHGCTPNGVKPEIWRSI